MTANGGNSTSEPGDQPALRSGGLLAPTGPACRSTTWYACPEPDCRYRERARSDGSLAEEFCPRHGALLVLVASDEASG